MTKHIQLSSSQQNQPINRSLNEWTNKLQNEYIHPNQDQWADVVYSNAENSHTQIVQKMWVPHFTFPNNLAGGSLLVGYGLSIGCIRHIHHNKPQ